MAERQTLPALIDSTFTSLFKANQVHVVDVDKNVLRFVKAALESPSCEASACSIKMRGPAALVGACAASRSVLFLFTSSIQ